MRRLLTHLLGWRSIFFVNVPVGFLGLWLTLSIERKTPARTKHFESRGYSALATGLAFLPMTAMVALGGWFSSRIVERLGARRSMCIAFVLYAVGALTMMLAIMRSTYWPAVAPMLAIGTASGSISPAATSPALGTLEKSRAGVAAAVLSAAERLGARRGHLRDADLDDPPISFGHGPDSRSRRGAVHVGRACLVEDHVEPSQSTTRLVISSRFVLLIAASSGRRGVRRSRRSPPCSGGIQAAQRMVGPHRRCSPRGSHRSPPCRRRVSSAPRSRSSPNSSSSP